jgi:hypothetical protein
MTGTRTKVLSQPRGELDRARSRSPVVLSAVIAVQGAALTVLAGLDGSPMWRVARALAVIAVTSLAAWFTRRAPRAARGGTALVLGIVGTVVGAGVTSAHLKAALDAAAFVAGIVLVTGVILLVWGATALVRAVPGWWRLLAIPAALALLWFVLFPLTAAVIATNRPPGPLGSATPASYGLAYRNVAFGTALRRAALLLFGPFGRPYLGRSALGVAPSAADDEGVRARGPLHRAWLIVPAGFVALSAYAGAAGLIAGWLRLSASMTGRVPFGSPVFAGIALACVVAAPATVVAVLAWRRHPRDRDAATLAGVLLVGWIVVEVAVVRQFSVIG